MICFLCKTPLVVASMSVKTRNQPPEDVDERDYANFCSACTTLLFVACDDSRRRSWDYPIGAVDG